MTSVVLRVAGCLASLFALGVAIYLVPATEDPKPRGADILVTRATRRVTKAWSHFVSTVARSPWIPGATTT